MSDWTEDETHTFLNGIDDEAEKSIFEETEEFQKSDFESGHPVVLKGQIKESIDWRDYRNVVSDVKT